MWDVIRQKIRGGSMTTGSELVLELAEAQLVNVNINGSLLVSCDNVMGNMEAKAGEGEGKGLVFDTSQCGRVRMRHVRVENAGVNHEETVMESGDCWKHRPSRVESCRIVLHGNAEFEARRCTLCALAVVVAHDRLLGFRNRERMPVAETKLAVVAGK